MQSTFNRTPIRAKAPMLPALSREDEVAAIQAWLEENQATRVDPAYAAPSQAAPPPAVVVLPEPRRRDWSRAPRQDIEAALDEIARLFTVERLSPYAIGKRLGCNHRCIRYRLKRLGLLPSASTSGEKAGR